jgi:predicted transcriptional regulator
MNIIARLFRDIGQPDTGLTPAVEEFAGAVMRRRAMREGHDLEAAHSADWQTRGQNFTDIKVNPYQRRVCEFVTANPGAGTREIAEGIGRHMELAFRTLCRLEERGAVGRVKGPRNYARWLITDTGRASMQSGFLPPVLPQYPPKVAAE